jgi:hypothetical protein
MGIDVQLRKESGDIVEEVGDTQGVLSRASLKAFSGTRLLRYLMPWGDAMFNQAQAEDLLHDIYIMKSSNPGTPLSEILSKLEP